MNIDKEKTSSYLAYLPAVFQEDMEAERPNNLGQFLLAFERILTGLQDVDEPGLEEILEGIPNEDPDKRLVGVERYFVPGPDLAEKHRHRAPTKFLKWLSSWVALSLLEYLDEERQRDFIARAVSLYRIRGTKKGLEEVIAIYTKGHGQLCVEVNELNTPFQIGVHSQIGEDTIIDGGAPHFFCVVMGLHSRAPEPIRRHREVITSIVDTEKPAHTYYRMDLKTPAMQIGTFSTVGVDTLLGTQLC